MIHLDIVGKVRVEICQATSSFGARAKSCTSYPHARILAASIVIWETSLKVALKNGLGWCVGLRLRHRYSKRCVMYTYVKIIGRTARPAGQALD